MELMLTATVQLLNRSAEANGVQGRLTPPSKAVIKLRTLSDRRTQIIVATNKNPDDQLFYVDDIGVMRSRFLSNGMLTIEMSKPEITLMIREANQENLEKFFDRLKILLQPQQGIAAVENSSSGPSKSHKTVRSIAGETSKSNSIIESVSLVPFQSSHKCVSQIEETPSGTITSAKVGNRSQRENQSQESNDVCGIESNQRSVENVSSSSKQPNSTLTLRQSTLNFPVLLSEKAEKVLPSTSSQSVVRPHKRTRSPELTKNEIKSIKRELNRRNELSLSISNRGSYRSALEDGISKSLQCLTITNSRIVQLDDEFFKLKNLTVLDLCDNMLTSINQLKNIKSPLTILKVGSNLIQTIDNDLFNSFRNLKVLDLHDNLLKVLPSSILHLSKLYTLNVSTNVLEYLPYNMHYMKSLMELRIDNNHLNFIPAPLNAKNSLKCRKIDISRNASKGVIPREWEPIGEYHGFGSTCAPSLLELTGELMINQLNHCFRLDEKNPSVTLSLHDLPSTILPRSLKEYLQQGKKCVTCLKMSLRYCYRLTQQRSNLLAEEVCASSSTVSIKSAVCTTCLLKNK